MTEDLSPITYDAILLPPAGSVGAPIPTTLTSATGQPHRYLALDFTVSGELCTRVWALEQTLDGTVEYRALGDTLTSFPNRSNSELHLAAATAHRISPEQPVQRPRRSVLSSHVADSVPASA